MSFESVITIVAPLLLSGLTFLAYKHHSAFRVLTPFIFGTVFLIFVAFGAYDYGIFHSAQLVIEGGNKQAADEASKLLGDIVPTSWFWILAACSGYTTFLLHLQKLGITKNNEQ